MNADTWLGDAKELLSGVLAEDLHGRLGELGRAAPSGSAEELEANIRALAGLLGLSRDAELASLPGAARHAVNSAIEAARPGEAVGRLVASLLDRLDALKAAEAAPEGDLYIRAAEFGSRTRVREGKRWGELLALPREHPARAVEPVELNGAGYLVLGYDDAPNGWHLLSRARELTARERQRQLWAEEERRREEERKQAEERKRDRAKELAELARDPVALVERLERLERQLAEAKGT